MDIIFFMIIGSLFLEGSWGSEIRIKLENMSYNPINSNETRSKQILPLYNSTNNETIFESDENEMTKSYVYFYDYFFGVARNITNEIKAVPFLIYSRTKSAILPFLFSSNKDYSHKTEYLTQKHPNFFNNIHKYRSNNSTLMDSNNEGCSGNEANQGKEERVHPLLRGGISDREDSSIKSEDYNLILKNQSEITGKYLNDKYLIGSLSQDQNKELVNGQLKNRSLQFTSLFGFSNDAFGFNEIALPDVGTNVFELPVDEWDSAEFDNSSENLIDEFIFS